MKLRIVFMSLALVAMVVVAAAAPAGAVTISAADFVDLCDDPDDYEVTGTLVVDGGVGEILDDCTYVLTEGATLEIRNAYIHSDGCVDDADEKCRLQAIYRNSNAGNNATLKIIGSTIDVHSYVGLGASSAAGMTGGTVTILNSSITGQVVGVAAGSGDGGPGKVTIKNSSLTAEGSGGPIQELGIVSGNGGRATIVRSQLTSHGVLGIGINPGIGWNTSKTKVRRTTFTWVSALDPRIDGSPCSVTSSSPAAVDCVS